MSTAMVKIFVYSKNSYVEILMPGVLVSGGGVFGTCLGQEEGGFMNGTSALI